MKIRQTFKHIIGWLLLGGLVLVVIPEVASAAIVGGVGIRPANTNPEYQHSSSWFIYEIDPETTTVIEDTLLLLNGNDVDLEVKLEAVDAIVPGGGGFALLDANSLNDNFGDWVELESEYVIVPAKSNKVVNFTINIPNNPEVGDHIGGFVVRKSDREPDTTFQSGGATVRIITRAAARVYLTIQGDIIRDFAIKKRSFNGRRDKIIFSFTVENFGNIRADLVFDAKIYGLAGLYDEYKDVAIGQIFPAESMTKEVVWPGKPRPLFGPYLALITVHDQYEPMSHASSIPPARAPIKTWAITFFIPYTQTLVVLALLFLFWFIRQFVLWRRALNLARKSVVSYQVKKDDHLFDLAEDYNIPWKLLAKLNEIKPPYSLRNIKTLYIPDASGAKRDVKLPNFFIYLAGPLAKLTGRFKRKARTPKENEQVIIIEKGDKIRDVEKFTGMSWDETLAYNKLRSTFRLRAGQELLMPKPIAKKSARKRKGKKTTRRKKK